MHIETLMRGERILVTGGTGFIGSSLTEVLEEGGDVLILKYLSTRKLDVDASLIPIKTNSWIKSKKTLILGACEPGSKSMGRGCLGGKKGAEDFLMRRDILERSKYEEITIEYCSSNSEDHAGFIHRTDI